MGLQIPCMDGEQQLVKEVQRFKLVKEVLVAQDANNDASVVFSRPCVHLHVLALGYFWFATYL